MDDDDYDDGVLDDNLSVASAGTNNEVEGNTDFDDNAGGEWRPSATSSEFNSDDGENDPVHYRNMSWNEETLMFEYMTDDYTNFAVAILDENGNDIYRLDANESEIKGLINNDPNDKFIHIWREYEDNKKPHSWRVWPYSTSKGWCDRLTGNL
jgi:hypothetical protein